MKTKKHNQLENAKFRFISLFESEFSGFLRKPLRFAHRQLRLTEKSFAVISITLYFLSFFFLLFSSNSVLASSKFAGEFLTLGVGARPLAMGGSYAAIADDSTAAYWNPAGLGSLEHSEASFMHSSLFGLDSFNFFNYVRPLRNNGAFGLSWLRVGVDDIFHTTVKNPASVSADNRPEIKERFSNVDNAFFLSYGKNLRFDVNKRQVDVLVGANLKFIYTASYKRNALGIGGDCGILWERRFGNQSKGNRFAVGITAQDFFRTKLFWNTPPELPNQPSNTDIIMPNIKIGMSYLHNINALKSRVLLSVDTDSLYSFEMHYGLEYLFLDLLALRIGLQEKKGWETFRDVTAGAGLWLAFAKGAAFAVDYAFVSSDLGNSNRVSLMTRF
ncbi:PorV/PorQ family protein [Candidatus Poribacteria bacterium]|nr:PorV/PorQ family protein [Candidatus Poribacteria bacterium]